MRAPSFRCMMLASEMIDSAWGGQGKTKGQLQKVVEMLKNYPNEKLFLGA